MLCTFKQSIKIKMKFKIILVVVAMVLGVISVQAQNQAHVYKDSLLLAASGYIQHKASIDSLQTAFSQELQNNKAALEERYVALTKSYAPKEQETIEQLKTRMSSIDAEKLHLLQEEDKLLDTRIKSYNAQLEQQYNRDIKPILETIDLQIANYAKKHKIDYVFIMEEMAKSLAYINKGKDITNTIIELVNKSLAKQ